MGLGHKRADLRANAEAKLADAILLLEKRRFSNAYYLAGYAIEIGLKACIAAQIAAETIPDKGFITSVFKHELRSLVGLAGLSAALKGKEDIDPAFAVNWALVAGWTPEVRYETVDTLTAQKMLQAITDERSGVFQWIKEYW